ncbi:hypothetical protein IAI10_06450 [Clostridium sp. 19966]|uniref:DUF6483 family protein n=1 Tax=Clostridium sp. 19966 TaxID=2768166 RepID=UPI0028DDE76E|nr:DUF6483 family protein [Clostridium sp. 19966]MDT8716291.1 hypothetical protein [Clostridium sp. 19966]
MIKNDLFSEKMKRLGEVIEKIIACNKNNQYEASNEILNEAYKELLGIDMNLVNRLSYEDIVAFIGAYETSQSMKLIILGELLNLDANVKDKMNQHNTYINLCFKSLYAYLNSIMNDNTSTEICDKKVAVLLDILDAYEIDFKYKLQIIKYYELTGKFDLAEDLIYELLDSGEDKNEILDIGIGFYDSIKNKSKEELNNGNLPLSEVNEGLEMLLKVRNSQ